MNDDLKKQVMAGSTNMAASLSRELMGVAGLNWCEGTDRYMNRRQMFSTHLGKPFGAEAAADAEKIAANLVEKGNEQNPPDCDDDDRRPCSS